jgi:hypothetical protein
MGFFSDIAPIAALGAGVMTGNPGLIAGGLGMMGNAAQGQASQQGNLQAARMSQFRPVGITNTFGSSNFTYNPDTGQMESAGYTLSPELQAAQGTLMGGLGANLQDQAAIQAMGRQYMAQSPQEAAQQWMANQQALLAPSRQQAQANLNNELFTKGTGGLSVAQAGGGMSNPQQQAVANAQALQDLQLAAKAQEAGQQQYTFGQGLLSSAYDPYSAGLKAAGATEALGQQPLELSASLAGRSATAGANAAPYMKAATSYSPMGSLFAGLAGNTDFTNWAGSGMGNIFGGGQFESGINTSGFGF